MSNVRLCVYRASALVIIQGKSDEEGHGSPLRGLHVICGKRDEVEGAYCRHGGTDRDGATSSSEPATSEWILRSNETRGKGEYVRIARRNLKTMKRAQSPRHIYSSMKCPRTVVVMEDEVASNQRFNSAFLRNFSF